MCSFPLSYKSSHSPHPPHALQTFNQAEQLEAFRALEAAEHHLKQVEALVGPTGFTHATGSSSSRGGASGRGTKPSPSAAAATAPLLVEAQTAVQVAATAAGESSERLRVALAERDALAAELRAVQRRLEAAPLARRDEQLLTQLKVGAVAGWVGASCGEVVPLRALSPLATSKTTSHAFNPQDMRASLRDERAARATVTDALLGHAGRLRRKYRHLEGRYDDLAGQYKQVRVGGGAVLACGGGAGVLTLGVSNAQLCT